VFKTRGDKTGWPNGPARQSILVRPVQLVNLTGQSTAQPILAR